MRKLLFLTGLIALMSTNTQADKINISTDGSSSYTASEGTLYNFSDSLLNATANCTPYQEDFCELNPELRNIGTIFGGAEFQVLVDIKGLKDNNCEFEIIQNFEGIGGTKYICSITPETRAEILSAMKNRSTELVTETFTTYSTITSDGITKKIPTSQTLTDTITKITISKVLNRDCDIKEISPSEQEKKETAENMMKFPNNFISSLNSCTPNKHEFEVLFFKETIEIIGSKDQKCHVQTPIFDFYIPNNTISKITGYDKLYSLVADENIAKYKSSEKYSQRFILPYINECSDSSGTYTNTIGENNKIITSISAEETNNICTLKIQNILSINNVEKDYSLTCNISENNRNQIISGYKHLLNDDAEVSELHEAGKAILNSLIQNKLCSQNKV